MSDQTEPAAAAADLLASEGLHVHLAADDTICLARLCQLDVTSR